MTDNLEAALDEALAERLDRFYGEIVVARTMRTPKAQENWTDEYKVIIPETGGPFYPIPEFGPGEPVWKILRGAPTSEARRRTRRGRSRHTRGRSWA